MSIRTQVVAPSMEVDDGLEVQDKNWSIMGVTSCVSLLKRMRAQGASLGQARRGTAHALEATLDTRACHAQMSHLPSFLVLPSILFPVKHHFTVSS